MTEIANTYGQALYDLAKDEGLTGEIRNQLTALDEGFKAEPAFVQLLCMPSIPKQERCQVLDDSLRENVHPYVLNFLKILTEKGYMRHFSGCCQLFKQQYNQDNGILPVTAVTAVAMTQAQVDRLTEKLRSITGKRIELTNKLDPEVLGGMRLDYDGKRMDDTVSHRLDAVRNMLKNTVL